ncbi:MAG: putative membrane protein [Verrucomicrobiales bacterium]
MLSEGSALFERKNARNREFEADQEHTDALERTLGRVVVVNEFWVKKCKELGIERQLANTWLKDQPFYQFGMGIAIGFLAVYLVGLAISSFLGRWLWGQVDLLLMHVPLLVSFYQTFKQLLGYGEGPDAMFKRVVMVPCEDLPGEQLGFVTAEFPGSDDSCRLSAGGSESDQWPTHLHR